MVIPDTLPDKNVLKKEKESYEEMKRKEKEMLAAKKELTQDDFRKLKYNKMYDMIDNMMGNEKQLKRFLYTL